MKSDLGQAKATSLTQRVRESGFEIKTKNFTDRIGIGWIVMIKKDGKTTQRRARNYEGALTFAALARGIA